jgi:hypothetical protein
VSAAIAAGETTPLKAYQAYAATAGRPYARSSFEQLWRNHARRAGAVEHSKAPSVPRLPSDVELYVQSEAYWAEHVEPKPSRVAALAHPSLKLVVSVAVVAYAGTVFGFGVWARLLMQHSAATVAPFALLVPIVGMVAGSVVFGEAVRPVELFGGVLVMAGLALNVLGDWLLRRRAPILR